MINKIGILFLVIAGSGYAVAADQTPIEEIVVVGSKTERPLSQVPGHITTLDRYALEWKQVQGLGDIARDEPALEADFNTPRFGTTGLSIRGIGGNRVALELDGVPLPAQFDIGNFADNGRTAIDADIIERIEILRGPASALYGSDAIGGVVVISTIDPRDLAGEDDMHMGGGVGYFGSNDSTWIQATGAYAGDNDGVLLSLSRRDGHEPDNEARGVPDDRIDFGQWQLFGKWVHEFHHGGELAASLDFYHRRVDSDLKAVLGYQRFANTTSITGDDEQTRTRLTAKYAIGNLAWLDEFSLMAYRQINDTEQGTSEERTSGGVPLRLERDFFLEERSYGGEMRLRRDFNTNRIAHVLVAGVEWDRQHLTERRDALQTNRSTGVTTKNLLGEQFPLRDFPDTRTDEVGVYLQDEISYRRFTLIPAVRWDDYSLNARTDTIFTDPTRLTDLQSDELTFRLGATFRASDQLTLYGNFAEGFRAPPAEDVNLFLDLALFNVQAIPNPDLKPETSENFELGLRWRSGDVSFKTALYYSTFEDFIESRTFVGVDPATGRLLFQSRNLEEATIYGAEADFSLPLATVHEALADWRFDTGVHWARGENDVTGAPLNAVSPLKAVVGLHWQSASGRLESGLQVRYRDEQSRLDFSGGEFFVPPSATVIDATARYTPFEWMTWHLGLYNLTDKRYWRYSDVRFYESGDPRIEVASRPGLHANLTVRLRY